MSALRKKKKRPLGLVWNITSYISMIWKFISGKLFSFSKLAASEQMFTERRWGTPMAHRLKLTPASNGVKEVEADYATTAGRHQMWLWEVIPQRKEHSQPWTLCVSFGCLVKPMDPLSEYYFKMPNIKGYLKYS